MTHNVVFAPNFIKSRLAQDQVPTKWNGMIDPVWTDKLVAATFLLPRLGSYLALEWGLEETERWTRTLMDQRKMLVTTATVTDFLASGERPLAPAETTFGVFVLRRDKYDAAYQIMNLVPVSQFLAAVVKGRATDTLLDSYEAERIGFARKLVASTDRAFTSTPSGILRWWQTSYHL